MQGTGQGFVRTWHMRIPTREGVTLFELGFTIYAFKLFFLTLYIRVSSGITVYGLPYSICFLNFNIV